MLKRTFLALGATALMCSAIAQTGTTNYNINENMKPEKKVEKTTQESKSHYYMGTWADDYGNWDDGSKWMSDIWMNLSPRDRTVLQQALWRLPGNEERTVRMALQKCHKGYEGLAPSDSNIMAERKFMMTPTTVWNKTLNSLSTWERRNMAWTWEHMTPSERDALMAALTACCERHWATSKGSGY